MLSKSRARCSGDLYMEKGFGYSEMVWGSEFPY